MLPHCRSTNASSHFYHGARIFSNCASRRFFDAGLSSIAIKRAKRSGGSSKWQLFTCSISLPFATRVVARFLLCID